MGPPLFPTVFWCDAPEAGPIGAVSLFKFRRIKHLVVAAITEFVVPRAAPLDERIRKEGSLTGDRGFESLYPSKRLLAGRHCRLAGPGRPTGSSPTNPCVLSTWRGPAPRQVGRDGV